MLDRHVRKGNVAIRESKYSVTKILSMSESNQYFIAHQHFLLPIRHLQLEMLAWKLQ